MKMPKLKFQKYIASKFEECLELFELNCPAYFAEEEREDYRKFLQHDKDIYLLGYENDSLACCFGITEHNIDLCSLSWIMVQPNRHKNGFGNEMMSYFINYAKETIKKTALISTSQHANKFFEKYGAREIAFKENGWGRGMHKIDMRIDFNL
tara:strand:- start:203 stop:658 length:456 start_codon:yes stop_codon:yes gene_type:complete